MALAAVLYALGTVGIEGIANAPVRGLLSGAMAVGLYNAQKSAGWSAPRR